MGQELPLTLLHDPPLKDLRGVVRKDLHRLLQDDGAAVALLADEVDGGAGQLDPVLQGLLMDVKAVTARSREGGDQGGVDVEDGVGEGADHLTGEDDHEAGQDHQVDVQRPQLLHQAAVMA